MKEWYLKYRGIIAGLLVIVMIIMLTNSISSIKKRENSSEFVSPGISEEIELLEETPSSEKETSVSLPEKFFLEEGEKEKVKKFPGIGRRFSILKINRPSSARLKRNPFVMEVIPEGFDIKKLLNLQGIVYNPYNRLKSYAIVNGKMVKEGEEVKNFQVMKIEKDKVILKYGGQKFTLTQE